MSGAAIDTQRPGLLGRWVWPVICFWTLRGPALFLEAMKKENPIEKPIFVVFLLGLPVLWSLFTAPAIVTADIPPPAITVLKVYFEKEGKPYRQHVSFTVTCFGPARKIPDNGPLTAEAVLSFSSECPDYGCELYQPYPLDETQVEYCNMTGKAGDRHFTIEHYAKRPAECTQTSGTKTVPLQAQCVLKVALPD